MLRSSGLRLVIEGADSFRSMLSNINNVRNNNQNELDKLAATHGKNSTNVEALAKKHDL